MLKPLVHPSPLPTAIERTMDFDFPDYNQESTAVLRQECSNRNLRDSGPKRILVRRLERIDRDKHYQHLLAQQQEKRLADVQPHISTNSPWKSVL